MIPVQRCLIRFTLFSLVRVFFFLVCARWGTAQVLILDYKGEQPTRPGQLGFIDYHRFYITEDCLRRDVNHTHTFLFERGGQKSWEINHVEKTIAMVQLEPLTQADVFVRKKIETLQLLGRPVELYECRVEHQYGWYVVHIGFSTIEEVVVDNGLLEILTQQDMAKAFPEGVPNGVPVLFEMTDERGDERTRVFRIELLSTKLSDGDADLCDLPPGYSRLPASPN